MCSNGSTCGNWCVWLFVQELYSYIWYMCKSLCTICRVNNVVSYTPSCEVIHFLSNCSSYIWHYYIYLSVVLASPSNIINGHCIPSAGQWSYSVRPNTNIWDHSLGSIVCTMQVKPTAAVVLLFHYAGLGFSATFPAADLFSTCYRYSYMYFVYTTG